MQLTLGFTSSVVVLSVGPEIQFEKSSSQFSHLNGRFNQATLGPSFLTHPVKTLFQCRLDKNKSTSA